MTKAYNMEVILIQKEISDTFVTKFWENVYPVKNCNVYLLGNRTNLNLKYIHKSSLSTFPSLPGFVFL